MPDRPEKIALFPGTFDPFTNGHVDVIRRGQGLFDRIIVAIGRNPAKAELFSQSERLELIRQILAEEKIDAEAEVARVLEGWREGDPGYSAGLRFTGLDRAARSELVVALAGLPPPVPTRRQPIDYAETVRRIVATV